MKPKPQPSLTTICAMSVRTTCLVRERKSYGSWTQVECLVEPTATPYDLRIVSQVFFADHQRAVLTAS
jgi:hypothetical protein